MRLNFYSELVGFAIQILIAPTSLTAPWRLYRCERYPCRLLIHDSTRAAEGMINRDYDIDQVVCTTRAAECEISYCTDRMKPGWSGGAIVRSIVAGVEQRKNMTAFKPKCL